MLVQEYVQYIGEAYFTFLLFVTFVYFFLLLLLIYWIAVESTLLFISEPFEFIKVFFLYSTKCTEHSSVYCIVRTHLIWYCA